MLTVVNEGCQDPDWNVLGKKGIRGRNSVKVLLGEEEADGEVLNV